MTIKLTLHIKLLAAFIKYIIKRRVLHMGYIVMLGIILVGMALILGTFKALDII